MDTFGERFSVSGYRWPYADVVEEKILDEKLLSVATDAGWNMLAKDTKSKKGIICSQLGENHNVFIQYPKDPNCEVRKKTTQHEPGVEWNQRSAWMGLRVFQILETWSRHNILNVVNELTCAPHSALTLSSCKMISRIGFRIFHWRQKIQRKRCRGYRDSFWNHRIRKIFTQTAPNILRESCQYLRSNDTSAHHRPEMNGMADRAVHRVKEGTVMAFVRSGLPEESWDCSMECYCSLRNVPDKMADGKTAFEKISPDIWRTINFLFGTLVE